ncbi:hypothetical protein LDENG_00130770 [Lucifuga dentata]|nr:hypothetical protein LDENG_00130770 [Lucifuga dentata]
MYKFFTNNLTHRVNNCSTHTESFTHHMVLGTLNEFVERQHAIVSVTSLLAAFIRRV